MNTQKSDEELVEAVIENATDYASAPDGDEYPYINVYMLRKELKTCITTIRQEVEERERRRIIHSWNKAKQQLDGTAQGAVNAIEQFRETLKALSQNKV